MGTLTPTVDRARCMGHGRCFDTAPENFEPDDDGFGVVLGPAADEAATSKVRLAALNCPERAITLEETPA